jgi:hypothetical protein
MMETCYKTLLVLFLSVAFIFPVLGQHQQEIDSLLNVLKSGERWYCQIENIR